MVRESESESSYYQFSISLSLPPIYLPNFGLQYKHAHTHIHSTPLNTYTLSTYKFDFRERRQNRWGCYTSSFQFHFLIVCRLHFVSPSQNWCSCRTNFHRSKDGYDNQEPQSGRCYPPYCNFQVKWWIVPWKMCRKLFFSISISLFLSAEWDTHRWRSNTHTTRNSSFYLLCAGNEFALNLAIHNSISSYASSNLHFVAFIKFAKGEPKRWLARTTLEHDLFMLRARIVLNFLLIIAIAIEWYVDKVRRKTPTGRDKIDRWKWLAPHFNAYTGAASR